MVNENKETKSNHEVAIALIQRDVQYIKDSMNEVKTTLAVFDRNFARKDEVKEMEKLVREVEKDLKDGFNGLEKTVKIGLESKVDRREFEPIKTTLTRINWLIISTVIIGLLSLVIQKT